MKYSFHCLENDENFLVELRKLDGTEAREDNWIFPTKVFSWLILSSPSLIIELENEVYNWFLASYHTFHAKLRFLKTNRKMALMSSFANFSRFRFNFTIQKVFENVSGIH